MGIRVKYFLTHLEGFELFQSKLMGLTIPRDAYLQEG
jgi:hypothetical protein